ncbi:MAG: DUF4321 domain-containing protein [Candidatus Eiseniibacteriota bacterium]|jgi:hypothetical protein
MAVRKIRFGLLVLILLLGLIVGSAIGHALGVVLPEGAVRTLLVQPFTWAFGPSTLNLVVCSITIGFSLDVNVMGVLGVILLSQLLKWY